MRLPAQLELLPPVPNAELETPPLPNVELIPPSNLVEIDGNNLVAFLHQQQEQGRRVLSMAVIGNARYRVHLTDENTTRPHSVSPATHFDCAGVSAQRRAAPARPAAIVPACSRLEAATSN